MAKVEVKGSIFDEDVDVQNKELLKDRLDYLEKEMIIPPQNVKSIIDKTATFVKKNGKMFEQKIYMEKQKQFDFIKPDHPYFLYYQYKLHELFLDIKEKELIPLVVLDIKKKEEQRSKKKNEHILQISDYLGVHKENETIPSIKDANKKEEGEEDTVDEQNEEPIEIKEDMFTTITPLINSVDIDIIKTTALFVAKNGTKFLNELIEREKNNSQYDFLKSNNLYFNFFSHLIDMYLKCLTPKEDITNKLKDYTQGKYHILKYCHHLYQHNTRKKNELKKLEEKKKAEAYYDWRKFVVVETITFDMNHLHSLPPSIDFSNIENYILHELFNTDRTYTNEEKLRNLSYHMNNSNKNAYEVDDEPMQNGEQREQEKEEEKEEIKEEAEEEEPLITYEDRIADKTEYVDSKFIKKEDIPEEEVLKQDQSEEDLSEDEKIILVRNYDKSKKHKLTEEKNLHVCPITSKPIDINDITKHLKTLLLDPKWKEQKDKLYEKAKKEASFAPLEDIEGNLSLFVVNRPDIFGSIDEEINEHSVGNENKLYSSDHISGKKEESVYSYINTIYNKILPGPAPGPVSQKDKNKKENSNSNEPVNKKQKQNT